MTPAEAIAELEAGTAGAQRRRFLALLAGGDLEGQPAGGDIDLERCPATEAAAVVVHCRQDSPRCPQAMKPTDRDTKRHAGIS